MQYRKLEPWQMRIDSYEDSRIQGRIGATAAIGGLPCPGRLPSANRCRVFGCSSQFGMPLDESLSPRRRWRFGGARSLRSSAQTHPPRERQVLGWFRRSPTSFGFPTELWTAAQVARVIYRKWRIRFHPRYLNQWLAERRITPQKPRFQAREQDEDEVQRWLREDWPRIKKVRRGGVPTSF